MRAAKRTPSRAARQADRGRRWYARAKKLHNFVGMTRVSKRDDAHEEAARGSCSACRAGGRRHRHLAMAQAAAANAAPRYETVAVDRGSDRREGHRDRHAVGAGDGPGRHPGLGAHRGDHRRLQLAGEEGPGDREDRSAAVRGRARAGARELPGRRRATVAKLRGAGRERRAAVRARRGAVRPQGDRAGRPRHRARDRCAPRTATSPRRAATWRRRRRRCTRRR